MSCVHLLAVILSSSFLGGYSVHVLGNGVHKMEFCCFFQGSSLKRTTMSWSLRSHEKVCGCHRPTEHFLYSDNREKPAFTLCWNQKKKSPIRRQQHWSKCSINLVLIKIWLDDLLLHLNCPLKTFRHVGSVLWNICMIEEVRRDYIPCH